MGFGLLHLLSLGSLALRGELRQAAGWATNCNQSVLKQTVDRYIAAQSTGQVEWLQKVLDSNATYLENGRTRDLRNSTMVRPLKIDRTHTLYDTTQCATFTELVVTNPSDPWVIGAQIRVYNGKVTKIDRVATGPGDWVFNATRYLHYALLEDWTSVPNEKRDSREVLQAAADAYFNHLGNRSVPVPWGYPCTRLEGGEFSGKGFANDTCELGIPDNTTMLAPNRRYVIDESVGAVSMLLDFGGFGNAPDSHEFRIEQGRIKRVHTMTYCDKKPNCGMESPYGVSPDPGW